MPEISNARAGVRPVVRSASEALAAAVAIAGGTAAYAEPIRFDNDGAFDWRPAECGAQNWLDITLDSAGQPNQEGDTSFGQWYYYGQCNDPDKAGNYMYAGFAFSDAAWVQANGYGGTVDRLESGYLVNADSAFGDRSTLSIYSSPCCYENDWGKVGAEGYIGVEFKEAGQRHFGWIKARLTDPRGAQLEALAWGYDSTPDTPVKAGDGGRTCYPDFDKSGELDLFDFLAFVNAFNAGEKRADCDGNGNLDLFDFLCFVNAFNVGC